MPIEIAKYTRLPSLPGTAMEVVRLYNDPNCSIDQLIDIVRADPAIVSKLLRSANSAVYGIRGEVTDLKRAVMLLGRNTVTPLVLSFSLAQLSSGANEHARFYEEFWERSYYRATAAEVLCHELSLSAQKEEAYTTCLLAGLGRLALLKTEPARTVELLHRAVNENVRIEDLEVEVFGFSHRELSVALLDQMGLPTRIVEAVQNLCEDAVTEQQSSDGPSLGAIIHTADAIARFLCDDDRGAAIVALEESLEVLGSGCPLTASDLIELVRARVDVTASLFDVDSQRLPSATELLEIALDQLSTFAAKAVVQPQTNSVPRELLEENGRLKRRVADLLEVAHHDPLTGVGNRQYFENQFSERIALAAVRGESLGLAVIDIDHFKNVNDTYGHLVGDRVLKSVADALVLSARDSDLVARFGGEEFVVLITDPMPQALTTIGDRFRASIAQRQIDVDGSPLSVTCSVGLSAANVAGDHQAFADHLFASADRAMYVAKNAGRNRVVVGPFERDNAHDAPLSASDTTGRPQSAPTPDTTPAS